MINLIHRNTTDKNINTKGSQKFQLTHKDLEKACKIINFNIPYAYLNESEMFGEWEEITKISPKGKTLLKTMESLRLKPYDDQNGKEIKSYIKGATIGYGHLISFDEWDLYKNGIILKEADCLFDNDLNPFERAVSELVKSDLTQTQFDALVIFCFNIGINAFKNSSVLKIINGETANYKTLESAWKAWNKSQGRVMKGLNNRRNAEYKLYHQGIYEGW